MKDRTFHVVLIADIIVIGTIALAAVTYFVPQVRVLFNFHDSFGVYTANIIAVLDMLAAFVLGISVPMALLKLDREPESRTRVAVSVTTIGAIIVCVTAWFILSQFFK